MAEYAVIVALWPDESTANKLALPVVTTFDSPGLCALREAVRVQLGFLDGDHGFCPHLTLAYLPEDETENPPIPNVEATFDRITLAWGDPSDLTHFPLTGEAITAATEPPEISIGQMDPALGIALDHISVAEARYKSAVVTRGLSVESLDSWGVDGIPTEGFTAGKMVFVTHGHYFEATVESDTTLSYVEIGDGRCRVRVAGAERSDVEAAFASFRQWTGVADPIADGRLGVTFWAMGPMGPFSVYRPVDAPGWADVQDNYPTEIREQLDHLMKGPLDLRGGQMMIWNGPPGTGKTWALRALGSAWADWCTFEYITDPDRFLEDGAAYLLQVLLEGGRSEDEEAKWRILVLEDAGELLTVDAKDRVGQGLSRFLNAADGFLGQGLKTIMLVTTNEEMASMHPAVSRPGRCFASVEFVPFTSDEASTWLGQKVQEPLTLAEMYALTREEEQ